MLAFDGDGDVIRVDIGAADPILDALGAPHASLRPDGLLVRSSACKSCPRTLRVTHGGGLYVCNGDHVLQSFDLRTLAHIVPLVLATGATTTRLPMVREGGFNEALTIQHTDGGGIDFTSRPRMEEELVRTALVLVWHYGNSVRQQSALEASQRALLSNRSFGSSMSLSTTQQPLSGSSESLVRHHLLRQQEQLEEPLDINSKERAALLAERCLLVELPTRRAALKLFEAIQRIVLERKIVLSPPPEPKQIARLQPGTSSGTATLPRQHRRRDNLSNGGGSVSSAGDDDASSNGRSNSDDDDDSDDDRKRRAVTEASTHLRELFEQTDDALDDKLEAESRARRRGGKAAGGGDVTQTVDVLEEDTLQKDSTALAQSIIEKLTAMKISIKSPFPLIHAFVENSPAQLSERRLFERHHRALGADASGEHHPTMTPLDGVPTDMDTEDKETMAVFQRLEQSKGPLPVLEALRSRRPEYISKSGALEFFEMCNVLYKKDRELLSQRAATNAMHRRVGFTYLKHFTGPAVKRLFESWVLQRRREAYGLQQYVMDLLQYYWYLRRCDETEVQLMEEEQAAERGGEIVAERRSVKSDDPTTTLVAASTATATAAGVSGTAGSGSGGTEQGTETVHQVPQCSDADVNSQTDVANPLALYAAAAAASSGSVEQLLDLCRRVHIDIEALFAARRLRYTAAGVADPLAQEAYYGKRSRSNVFPDPVMDQLELQKKKSSVSS